jgi:hypothetical protein
MTNCVLYVANPVSKAQAVIVGVPEQAFGTARFEQAWLGQPEPGTGQPDF